MELNEYEVETLLGQVQGHNLVGKRKVERMENENITVAMDRIKELENILFDSSLLRMLCYSVDKAKEREHIDQWKEYKFFLSKIKSLQNDKITCL